MHDSRCSVISVSAPEKMLFKKHENSKSDFSENIKHDEIIITEIGNEKRKSTSKSIFLEKLYEDSRRKPGCRFTADLELRICLQFVLA